MTSQTEGAPMHRAENLLTRLFRGATAACGKLVGLSARGRRREEGAAAVEVALASTVMFAIFFGLIEFSMALFTYEFVSDAARKATRYAVVRGPSSCTISPTFPNCNMSAGAFTSTTSESGNPILYYINHSLNYPGLQPMNMSATVKYYYATVTDDGAGGYSTTTWTTVCTSDSAVSGDPCNNLGNAVQVVVTYQYSVNIPFSKKFTIPVSSTSQMVISE